MPTKPILFCSSKAVPHIALISHFYDFPLTINRKNKPSIIDPTSEKFTKATYFTQQTQIQHPIYGHLPIAASKFYRDYIIDNKNDEFNLINYSELLNDDDFDYLRNYFEIIQLEIEPNYRKILILQRLFRLYDLKQIDYILLDQGLTDHRDQYNEKIRLHTYMTATNWSDRNDVKGFVDFLLSDHSPILQTLIFEDAIKKLRKTIKMSYQKLFFDIDDYYRMCVYLNKKPDPDKWLMTLNSIALPEHLYWCGDYWDITKLDL